MHKDTFLKELEIYLHQIAKLGERSIRIYLRKIRNLLDSGFSVEDLCGAADRLYEDYGARGQLYDPKDHGNTRAAVKHVANLVREKLLEECGCPYVSFDKGWSSFRPTGEEETGYVIEDGEITFFYDRGFCVGKNVSKKLSVTDIRKLIMLFTAAEKAGLLAASDTCMTTFHGPQYKYDYAYADAAGRNCGSLFDGRSANGAKLNKAFADLVNELRK